MHDLSDKGRRIRRMFDGIARRYDLLNRLLSLGIDRRWRTRAASLLDLPEKGLVLDLAAGTCDVALAIAARAGPGVLVVAEDFSAQMLQIGAEKVARSPGAGRILLLNALCEEPPHRDASFDGAIMAFGIRNVADRPIALSAMRRVLKPGAKAVILEFSAPRGPLFGRLYALYLNRILPLVGGLLSAAGAYRYLPESVAAFPDRASFARMMEDAGFANVRFEDMTLGIVTAYTGYA